MSIIRKVALLTGATGFIGSNIAMRLLLDGWKVHVLCRDIDKFNAIYSNENFQAHELDGSTTNVVEHMRSIDPSVVFHLASYFVAENSSDDVEKLINSNTSVPTLGRGFVE